MSDLHSYDFLKKEWGVGISEIASNVTHEGEVPQGRGLIWF